MLLLIKQYFAEVWAWELNNQFASTAPLNAMADNIGGTTLHSFGSVLFKDRRGILVNLAGYMDGDKQSLKSKKWNSLRVLLCDEIEAAGMDVIGKIEHSMQQHAPVIDSVIEGLQVR